MADQPPVAPEAKDFPDHWGFYLMQAINRLEDEQRRTADALRQEITGVRQEITGVRQEIVSVRQEIHALDAKFDQKIEALDTKFDQKIEALDTKFDQKLTALQYWYWGTLVVIIIGFVTLLLTHA